MPSENSRSALRISMLFAVVLIGADLLLDFIVLNLALAPNTRMQLLVVTDIPLAVAYVAYLYSVLRREFDARSVIEDERAAANARVQESESRLRLIMDNLPAAISYLDRDLRYTFANAGYDRLMGRAPSALVGQRFPDIMPPRTSQIALPQVEAALAGETRVYENDLPKAGGGTFRALVQLVPDRQGDEVVGVHVLLTDISQLRETQEALAREHQEALARAEELQAVLEAVPVPIYVSQDPECTVITGNRLAYEMLGAEPGTNLSRTGPDPSERPPHTVETEDTGVEDEELPMQRAGRTGQAVRNYEFVLTLPDGARREMFGHAVPLLNAEGLPRGVIAAFSDVTALKLAGEELRQSREQYKRMAELAETRRIEWELLFDNMNVGVALFDADGKLLAANQRHLTQHGFPSVSEMAGVESLAAQFEVTRPDGSPVSFEDWPLTRALRGERAVEEFVVRINKTGNVMRARYTCAPIRNKNGKVARVFQTVEDVTDLRMAEAAARAHANELQTLLDAVPTAVFIARDPDCEVMTGSDLAYQLLRRPKGSNLSKTAPESERPNAFRALHDGREIEPEDLPLQRAARTGVGERNYQFDLAFEDGEIVSLIGNAVPLLDERGHSRGAIGAFADITGLKRTEAALRAAEATMRQQLAEIEAVYNTLPVGLALIDTQLRYRRVNERLAEINGIPATEHIGKSVREVLPQFADTAEDIIARIMETGEPAPDVVFTGTTGANSGTERTWIEHWVPFLDPLGEIEGINVVVEDVTEQRRVQADLLESQELMHRALDVGRGFAFQYQMRSDQVVRSPESAKILGLAEGPDATKDTGPDYFQRVHPQDRSRYVARMLGLTPANDNYRTTYRVVRPDGRTIAVEESARGLFDEDGTLIQVFGITQDVTERVQAEQERERLLEQVQAQQARLAGLARDLQAERDVMAAIMENTRTQLAYLDPQFRFVKVNSAYAGGAGRTPQALLGKDHFSLFPNEENQAIFEHVRETGQPVEFRARPFEYADQLDRGTTYWDWTLVPVKNPDGAVRGLVFSLSDVTEQKRAEEVLRTARDELQQRVSEATAELRAVVVSLEAEIADRERAEALLRESEARLRILVEQVPAVLWTTDRELVYTSSEGAGLAAINVEPGQLVGTRVPGIPGVSSDQEAVVEAHRRALNGEGVTFRTQWGEAHFEGYIEPLREADGTIVGCIGVALDITARVRSEELQREREQQYRNIFESTSDGMVIIDADGQIVDANPAASKMSGYDHEEFLHLDPLTFIRSDQREPLERFFQSVQTGRRLERQAMGVRKDGSEFDLEVRASQFQHAGKPHVLAVLRDITERVRSFQLLEQRVRERTRELSALLAFSRQATATLEVRPLMELVVQEVSRLVDSTGVSLLMLEGETLKMAAHRGPLPASTAEQVRLTVNDPGLRGTLLTNPTPIVLSDVQMEGQHAEAMRRAGEPFMHNGDTLHSMMWIPLVVKQKLIGGIGIGHKERGKYTERDAGLVQAIAGQAAVALENARLYEQAHELAVMTERQRLARELHDSVTQSLYSLSLMAEAARRLVAAGNKDRGMGYLVRIGESAQQVLKEMRLLVYELRPLMLERDGLASALKQRLETVEGRAGVETKLVVEGTGLLPEHIETELYRIAQEALNNSLKHSNASSVAVTLSTGGDPVSLTVQDNGRGFSAEEIEDKGGLGLVGMQERAQRLGGWVDVASAPGEGVAIKVTIPLSGNPRK